MLSLFDSDPLPVPKDSPRDATWTNMPNPIRFNVLNGGRPILQFDPVQLKSALSKKIFAHKRNLKKHMDKC